MDKAQAVNAFWNSFGLIAYDVNSVPTDAQMPYITYDFSSDEMDFPVLLSASVWYRSMSWVGIESKAKEIETRLEDGGELLKIDGGYVWITKAHPFRQRMNDPSDDMIKRYYINVQSEFLSK